MTRKQSVVPATLVEAHEVLWRQRPSPNADPAAWAAFHRHCAQVYMQTGEVDSRRRHEATQCAGLEIRKARDIEHRIGSGGDDA